MKSIYTLAAVTSVVFLASCDRTTAEASKAPTQAEEIAEFCNVVASDFAANPSAPTSIFMGRMQRKIIEEEWDAETVINACSDALDRKAQFIQQQTRTIQGESQ